LDSGSRSQEEVGFTCRACARVVWQNLCCENQGQDARKRREPRKLDGESDEDSDDDSDDGARARPSVFR
jgi:hypothetical protein